MSVTHIDTFYRILTSKMHKKLYLLLQFEFLTPPAPPQMLFEFLLGAGDGTHILMPHSKFFTGWAERLSSPCLHIHIVCTYTTVCTYVRPRNHKWAKAWLDSLDKTISSSIHFPVNNVTSSLRLRKLHCVHTTFSLPCCRTPTSSPSLSYYCE